MASSSTKISAPSPIRQDPIYFIADTDSRFYIIDTGASRVIVNDATLLKDIKISPSRVKEIGGTKVRISGTGKLTLLLKSDDGQLNLLPNVNAVLLPSSPYNLLPP